MVVMVLGEERAVTGWARRALLVHQPFATLVPNHRPSMRCTFAKWWWGRAPTLTWFPCTFSDG